MKDPAPLASSLSDLDPAAAARGHTGRRDWGGGPARRPFAQRLARAATTTLAIGYPVALLLIAALFRFVGERWWVTLVALYLPRWGFALPLPIIVVALFVWGPRRLLVVQALSLALLLFPLMGLELNLRRPPAGADGAFRVVAYNIHLGIDGIERVAAQIEKLRPNLVVLQEARRSPRTAPLFAKYEGDPTWHVHNWDQFTVFSRFPIRDVFLPPKLSMPPHQRSPRFVRYTLETPTGLVDVYNAHPISPRDGFDELRGAGIGDEVRSGRLFAGARRHIEPNSALRRRQVEEIARLARESGRTTIIAGDTNLPGQSWLLHDQLLGTFDDGFAEAGRGFGYTFPARRPWMRIDRVLADRRLRFVGFEVGNSRGSDHRAVLGVLEPVR